LLDTPAICAIFDASAYHLIASLSSQGYGLFETQVIDAFEKPTTPILKNQV
jgi:hypothetical protein